MNILFITNTLPPVVDGVGDYTLNLAREFAKHGHHVSIVCKHDDRVRRDYTDIAVYPIVEKWDRKASKIVMQLIQKDNVNIVLLQYVPHGFEKNGLPFSLVHLTSCIKKRGIALFTFFHEVCIGNDGSHSLRRRIGSFCMALIAKRVALNSQFVATSIGHYKKRLEKLSVRNVETIPIPSNVPNCLLSESEISTLKKEIAHDDETIITLFGNRDFSIVVEAIEKIIDCGRKIKIIALGKANSSIPKKDFVFFTGPKPIEELSAYLKLTDILVLPEDVRSGCSLKSGSLAASLQFGIPTITTKGFMTDSVLDELFVFAKENTSQEYEHIISEMIDNSAELDIMRKRNLDFAKSLTWNATYVRYMGLMSTLKCQ